MAKAMWRRRTPWCSSAATSSTRCASAAGPTGGTSPWSRRRRWSGPSPPRPCRGFSKTGPRAFPTACPWAGPPPSRSACSPGCWRSGTPPHPMGSRWCAPCWRRCSSTCTGPAPRTSPPWRPAPRAVCGRCSGTSKATLPRTCASPTWPRLFT